MAVLVEGGGMVFQVRPHAYHVNVHGLQEQQIICQISNGLKR